MVAERHRPKLQQFNHISNMEVLRAQPCSEGFPSHCGQARANTRSLSHRISALLLLVINRFEQNNIAVSWLFCMGHVMSWVVMG